MNVNILFIIIHNAVSNVVWVIKGPVTFKE